MTPPGSSLLDCAMAALQGVSGEQLTYGAVVITATVDRNVVRGREFVDQFKGGENVDFSTLNMSRIEIRKADLPTPPTPGENFVDGYSYRHRIRAVVQTDVTWTCWCIPSVFRPKVPHGPILGGGGEEILGAGGEGINAA